jgi:hypothetical protein
MFWFNSPSMAPRQLKITDYKINLINKKFESSITLSKTIEETIAIDT